MIYTSVRLKTALFWVLEPDLAKMVVQALLHYLLRIIIRGISYPLGRSDPEGTSKLVPSDVGLHSSTRFCNISSV
jgi:hypothetical protein